MKILQIGSYPLDASIIRGGVESSVYGLAQEQRKSHDVVVLDIPRKGIEDAIERDQNLTVYRFVNSGPHQVDACGRIPDMMAVILKERPDICHVHGTGIFSYHLFNALKKGGQRAVVTVHGLAYIEKKKELGRKFSVKTLFQLYTQTKAEKGLLNLADKVIVDTEYVAGVLADYHLRFPPDVTIIPQGINTRFFSLSCSESTKEVLSVGTFSRRKGHLLLIRAFEKTCDEVKDAHLTICGAMTDSVYFSEIETYLSLSKHKDRITLVSGVSEKELDRLYEKAHIFALHSQEESQGIVLTEAMAAGLPVVATRVGGIPYVVGHRCTGLLSEYGDVEAFSNSLTDLLKDDSLWNLMSRQCRSVAQDYAWDKIASEVEKFYFSIE